MVALAVKIQKRISKYWKFETEKYNDNEFLINHSNWAGLILSMQDKHKKIFISMQSNSFHKLSGKLMHIHQNDEVISCPKTRHFQKYSHLDFGHSMLVHNAFKAC